MKTLKEKAESVLGFAYRGLHNVPGRIHEMGGGISIHVPTNTLATFDFDTLTRLVVMCHDECVRMSFKNSGPARICLRFTDRKRDGDFCERHDTIETAIKNIREKSGVTPI